MPTASGWPSRLETLLWAFPLLGGNPWHSLCVEAIFILWVATCPFLLKTSLGSESLLVTRGDFLMSMGDLWLFGDRWAFFVPVLDLILVPSPVSLVLEGAGEMAMSSTYSLLASWLQFLRLAKRPSCNGRRLGNILANALIVRKSL